MSLTQISRSKFILFKVQYCTMHAVNSNKLQVTRSRKNTNKDGTIRYQTLKSTNVIFYFSDFLVKNILICTNVTDIHMKCKKISQGGWLYHLRSTGRGAKKQSLVDVSHLGQQVNTTDCFNVHILCA